MRNFEKIIGEKFLTHNIENNEYSYQKRQGKNPNLSREKIATILGKTASDKLNKNLDRRFFNRGVAVLVEKKQGKSIKKYREQLENYIKLECHFKYYERFFLHSIIYPVNTQRHAVILSYFYCFRCF